MGVGSYVYTIDESEEFQLAFSVVTPKHFSTQLNSILGVNTLLIL